MPRKPCLSSLAPDALVSGLAQLKFGLLAHIMLSVCPLRAKDPSRGCALPPNVRRIGALSATPPEFCAQSSCHPKATEKVLRTTVSLHSKFSTAMEGRAYRNNPSGGAHIARLSYYIVYLCYSSGETYWFDLCTVYIPHTPTAYSSAAC